MNQYDSAGCPCPRLLTREEAANSLNISTRKLDDLLASKQIPKVRIGASVRIDPNDLRVYIKSLKEGGR